MRRIEINKCLDNVLKNKFGVKEMAPWVKPLGNSSLVPEFRSQGLSINPGTVALVCNLGLPIAQWEEGLRESPGSSGAKLACALQCRATQWKTLLQVRQGPAPETVT